MATPERWSVLVTGATGRIGFPIARTLARDHDVYGLARCSGPGDEARLRTAGIVPIVGDVAAFDPRSIPDVGGRPLTHVFHAAARIGAEARTDWQRTFEVNAQATARWIMTVDVGAHRILANHVIEARVPGQLMQSNGLGCMGYALPAAIAAQIVHPDRPVIALIGDGCMLMTQGELALAAERDLPLVIVVLNDNALSLIKLKQAKMRHAPRAVDFRAPRFDLIAQGFGSAGVRVTSLREFSDALCQAVDQRRLTVIDAIVDPSEYAEEM